MSPVADTFWFTETSAQFVLKICELLKARGSMSSASRSGDDGSILVWFLLLCETSWPKATCNLERIFCFVFAHIFTLQSVFEGSKEELQLEPGGKNWNRTQGETLHWIAPQGSLSLFSYSGQDYLPRVCTSQCDPSPLLSIINQEASP